MATEILSVDIQGDERGFFWVVRREKPSPVEELFASKKRWPTRSDALVEFQNLSEALGWANMVTEVLADT